MPRKYRTPANKKPHYNKQLLKRRNFLKSIGLASASFALNGCSQKPFINTTKQKPNILWITCEDISTMLACFGDNYAVTPNLDRLAAQGFIYKNAFATAPVSAPARSCLITGIYATSLGTQHLRSDINLPDHIKPFPKYLRRDGYYCSNNSKEDYNFASQNAWDDSSKKAHWRNRNPSQPFFAVFNLGSTHQSQVNLSDNVFQKKYARRLQTDRIHDPEKANLPPFYPDTPFVRKVWARYYDLVTIMDKQVGILLNWLEADGLAEDTIVFFFSDHGTGLPRHKRTLYDTGLKVPLIVRFPKKYRHLAPAEKPATINQLVSFVDFAPTVLKLASLPIPQHMQGRPFLGTKKEHPRTQIFAAADRVDEAYEMSRCVRDKRYKYIRHYMPHLPCTQPSYYMDNSPIMQHLRTLNAAGRLIGPQKTFWQPQKPHEQLYDTLHDPHEIKNLADSPAHQQILTKMRKSLDKCLSDTRDTGFLPEPQMHIRAKNSTPYQIAQNHTTYPLNRITAVAELTGKGPAQLPKILTALRDTDPAARYWAIIALRNLEPALIPTEHLTPMLSDSAPSVRFEAAGLLCRQKSSAQALDVLRQGLKDDRPYVNLYAARTLQNLKEKACPAKKEMKYALDVYQPDEKKAMWRLFASWSLKQTIQNCSG